MSYEDLFGDPGEWPPKGGSGGPGPGGTPGGGGFFGGGGGSYLGGYTGGSTGLPGLGPMLRRRLLPGPTEPGVAYAPGGTVAGVARPSAFSALAAPGGGGASYMPAGPATPTAPAASGGWQGPGAVDYASVYGFRPMAPGENPVRYHQSMLGNPAYQRFLADARSGRVNQTPAGQPGSAAYSAADPYAPFANDPRGDINGLINRIVGAGGRAGIYDPTGSPALREAVRSAAAAQGQQDQGQALLGARYFAGGDPSAESYAGLSSLLGSQSRTAQAVSNADLNSMLQSQSAIRSLAYGIPDYGHQLDIVHAGNPQGQGFDWGSLAGGLGGLIGAFRKPSG